MTREEAKKNLVAYMYYAIDDLPEDVGKAIDMAIKALEGKDTNAPTKWIPVNSKKLPKPQKIGDKDYSGTVVVTIKDSRSMGTIDLGYYCYSMKKWFAMNVVFGEVIAWKSLPEPYKAESEGEG